MRKLSVRFAKCFAKYALRATQFAFVSVFYLLAKCMTEFFLVAFSLSVGMSNILRKATRFLTKYITFIETKYYA